ncbi:MULTISPECIES: heparan-alpha-glucosaminide N-acetyltransferase domain-containing protein [Kocuria]|uniref:Heparan-alpha-glucosaminide N-acetyltransferase domain-containing protein n=1 Tax=Kocuria oceani TaxID=988827 RepID=A0ABV9TMZ0_9MICC|nr:MULTISPECIES: heparan-alpha-glucosaminide N-acetyltransferase domain-containing protein [Kocuria]WJZ68523.1 heparan-alpha-glucosaminide N-acetyltransferase domain-containing protein [Kocuria rosea]
MKKPRLVGVDAARGLALLGMFSIHILPAWDPETYEVTLQWQLFAGRAAALFALLAGVGLAFSTGAGTPHRGRTMTADRVGVLVRAVLITVLGLLVNQVMPEDPPAYNILIYYGVFFLLAIPFLHLPARTLFVLAGVNAVLAPVLMQSLRDALPEMETYNPTITGVLTDPGTVLSQVLLTGTYPAFPYLTYLLAGIAIGRLNLRSLHVQGRLLVAGLILALAAWLVYWVLILQAGGYDQLMSSTPSLSHEQIDEILIWGPDPVLPDTTWWWMLIPGPHTNTPIAILYGLGSGTAVLGAFLLIGRKSGAWLLPLSAAGSMTLTLYTAHLLALAAMVHYEVPMLWFLIHAGGAAVFAVAWQRAYGQGPLERALARTAGAGRGLVLTPGRRED